MAYQRKTLRDDEIDKYLAYLQEEGDSEEENNDEEGAPELFGSNEKETEEAFAWFSGGDELLDEESEENMHNVNRKRNVRNRLVHDLESSLNLSNYDLYSVPNEVKNLEKVMQKPTKKNSGSKITWQNQPPPNTGRQGSENILKTLPGLTERIKNVESPVELFFPNELLGLIIRNIVVILIYFI